MSPSRQVNIPLSNVMYTGLEKLAKGQGLPTGTYARLLLEAAYTSKVAGWTGDRDLDASVVRTVILFAGGVEAARISKIVGLSEPTVERVLDAWRNEVRGSLQ